MRDLFVGRSAELSQIAETLRRVAAGAPCLITIEGDPGMGKSALVRHALTQQALTGVLSARADPAETDLDFGVVDQLFRSAGGEVPPILPGSGPPASPFTVGARLLQVVSELRPAGPIVIWVDDVQWADQMSVDALTFMLRRLSVDPVAAMLTYRGPGGQLDQAGQRLLASMEHQLHLTVGGLSRDEVAELAAQLPTGPLDDQAVRRLYLGTGGHPLYVRTLGAAHGRAGPVGRLDQPSPLRDSATARGRRLRPGRPGPDGRGRTVCPAGPRERGQHGLHPGTGVRGHRPAHGQPGQRRLPGHGRPQPARAGRPGGFPAARAGLAAGLAGRTAGAARAGAEDLRAGQDGATQHAAGQDGVRQDGSPVYTARLLLAHGRLPRRTSRRADATELLGRARNLFAALRATPFTQRADQELAACRLPRSRAARKNRTWSWPAARPRSRTWWARACPTRKSPPSCSSAARRWSITWATSTPNMGIRSRQALRRLVGQWRVASVS